jgi:hypothetical protein
MRALLVMGSSERGQPRQFSQNVRDKFLKGTEK